VKQLVVTLATVAVIAAAFLSITPLPAFAVATTITITGNLTPDAAHWANNLILIAYPLVGVVFFTMILMMFKRKGTAGIHATFAGLLGGCLFADLPLSSGGPGFVEIGITFTAGILWGLYIWGTS
jgi:hypothetical protein